MLQTHLLLNHQKFHLGYVLHLHHQHSINLYL